MQRNILSCRDSDFISANDDARGESYLPMLESLREMFPIPGEKSLEDSRFLNAVIEGLRHLNGLRTHRPHLGRQTALDFMAARRCSMAETPATPERTIGEVAGYLNGMIDWGHPRAQINVGPPPTIAAIVGHLFGAVTNANLVSGRLSGKVALAEVEAAGICADLIGYDQDSAGGFFTFGGTGAIFYGVQLGLQKALPGSFRKGLGRGARIIASDCAHYAKLSAAGWLGLGMDNVLSVRTGADSAMDIAEFERILDETLGTGERVACIIASLGTTDAFGIDDLARIVEIRDAAVLRYDLDYVPHIHADAVIGWAWRVFDDYDFAGNPIGFPAGALDDLAGIRHRLAALPLADSVGLDFHKTGFTPYLSSLFLCRDRTELDRISRDPENMPYLFHDSRYNPGIFTLEASRSGGSALAALANLKLLGKDGFRMLLGHMVTMTNTLRRRLEALPHASVVNANNPGPVTLFRLYPAGIDAKAQYARELADPSHGADLERHNRFNAAIATILNGQEGEEQSIALSLTERFRETSFGQPIFALKSFMVSPFIDEAALETLMRCLDRAWRAASC